MGRRSTYIAYAALLAVYFFWGTTYIGIRISLESFPPFILMNLRFFLSGGILLLVMWLKGAKLPRGRELWLTALYGCIAIGFGTGTLCYAEQWVPSGLAALFITVMPFWMIGVDHLIPGGDKIHVRMLVGIAVGFMGVCVLLAPSSGNTATHVPGIVPGFFILQLGAIGWATGSILQRRLKTTVHPVVSAAIQQFATGVAFTVPAWLLPHGPVQPNTRTIVALFYLVIFGSIVGYSSYVFALEKLPVAIVSTYTYVNPVVAVILGYVFFREPFGMRQLLAMALIFVGVALVKLLNRPRVVQRRAAAA